MIDKREILSSGEKPVYPTVCLKKRNGKGECKMPTLSMFYGIIVTMHMEKSGRHNKPHIHARYSGEEVAIALDGEMLDG